MIHFQRRAATLSKLDLPPVWVLEKCMSHWHNVLT